MVHPELEKLKKIIRMVRTLTHPPLDPEDIGVEIWMELRGKVPSWRMVKNRVKDHLRRMFLEREALPGLVRDSEPPISLMDQTRLLDLCSRDLVQSEIRVVWLRFYQGMSVEEIGRYLGVSRCSAQGVLDSALRKMRARGRTLKEELR